MSKTSKQRLTVQTILQLLEKNKSSFASLGVEKLGLFGSVLHNQQKSDSDLDFLVSFNHPTFDNYMNLKFSLEKLFHRKIDLVTEKSLKPSLSYIKQEVQYVSFT
ncbi:MAG: nucleotidyltransferase family protein [Candidatus Diapherotrites archaeon]|nr:nucleotidyltransferase family protein [Candidatus Diapherotrites archaeon]